MIAPLIREEVTTLTRAEQEALFLELKDQAEARAVRALNGYRLTDRIDEEDIRAQACLFLWQIITERPPRNAHERATWRSFLVQKVVWEVLSWARDGNRYTRSHWYEMKKQGVGPPQVKSLHELSTTRGDYDFPLEPRDTRWQEDVDAHEALEHLLHHLRKGCRPSLAVALCRYFKGLNTMKQLGRDLGISESRFSQLTTRQIQRLRETSLRETL